MSICGAKDVLLAYSTLILSIRCTLAVPDNCEIDMPLPYLRVIANIYDSGEVTLKVLL